MDKVPASLSALRDIVASGQCVKFIWPRHENPKMRRPRLVDTYTAKAVTLCYDACRHDCNKEKLERMVAAGPVQFMRVVSLATSRLR